MPSRDGRPPIIPPLSDAIITTVSRLVDDALSQTRQPSHSEIDFHITQARLNAADPKTRGQTVGKAKRVRAVLTWALENNPRAGGQLVSGLMAAIQGCGGFRESSPNFVGSEAIRNAADAFRAQGYELSAGGELRPLLLDNLSGTALSQALDVYIRRAKRGAMDAALVTGTGKDLLEAVASHILLERCGSLPKSNFQALLGQTFVALGLTTTKHPAQAGEPPERRLERALFEVACAVNQLRNKEGTGHGHPWLPSVSRTEARAAIELMGIISELLLEQHRRQP